MILSFVPPLRGFLLLTSICFLGNIASAAGTNALPKVFYADRHALAFAKTSLAAGNPSLKPALDQLLKDADDALSVKPPTVMDKHRIPPSGDKHDYVSQAPYYWPVTNADGKISYDRRDGERNPRSEMDSDAGRLNSVCSNVTTLALAFYLTGDEKYADKAARFLRVFFLDPETKMNPNLNFGQGIPGEVDGRPFGLISARGFVPLMDSLVLLENSKAWTPDDQKQMRAWLEQYFNWLTTSKIGVEEHHSRNNHGSFYDDQSVAIALYLGKVNFARNVLMEAKTNRIARQIKSDGSQPLELARTKSFGYSSFNLRALMDMASIGDNLGIDLWHYRAPNGGSIYRALAFMAPYANPDKKWPYQQIHGYNHDALESLLLRAVPHYHSRTHLADALEYYQPADLISNRDRLLFPTAAIKIPAKAVSSSTNASPENLEE